MRGKANDGIILYKRHYDACPSNSMKRLSATAKRFFFECPCPIWMQGRLPSGEKVPRQSTGVNTLAEAEAVRESLIHETGRAKQRQQTHGVTIAESIETYLTSREHELSSKTLGQTRLLLRRLRTFCETRRVIHMHGLTVDLLERFKTEGLKDLANTSKSTSVSKLKKFLREAHRRDWIKDALAEKVRSQKAVYEQKEPYTDEEVEKILAEAERLNGGTHGYAAHPKTFRLLLELMLETGMRVGDAIRYNPTHATRSEVFWIYSYYPQKQKRDERPKPAEAYVPDTLKVAIDDCAWLTPGSRPFFFGSSTNPAYLANEVYARLHTIGSRCGVNDCRPHRFRDTFAVRCLLKGINLEDVSRLLNHSSVRVTEMYYARWVRARKIRLERILGQALANTGSDGRRD